MLDDLTKTFFNTFGIEPKYQDTCTVEEKYWQNEELANEFGTFDQYMNIKCGNQENCTTQCSCAYQKEIYPQITDRHYLELICLLNSSRASCLLYKNEKSMYGLKHEILADAIHSVTKAAYVNKNKFKHQVQAIFKGER